MSAFCHACGAEQPSDGRFCPSCGARRAAAPPPATAPDPAPARAGERRQMTVMFVDLVGSTDLVDRMDAEDLVDLVAAYHTATRETVERFGGRVVHYLGDGVVATFGYPVANEDDGIHAVEAGLAGIASLGPINARLGRPLGVELQVRVGVATGMIVAQGDAIRPRVEDGFIGASLNLASRLQAVASPGQVVIDPATRRLIGRHFATESLGPQVLKGFALPIEAFLVTGTADAASRLAFRLGTVQAPFVNRDRERGLLGPLIRKALAGEAQVVGLVGEAGIGKSRLAHVLCSQGADVDGRILTFQSRASLMNTALHPHIEALRRDCAIDRSDSADIQVRKLRVLLAAAAVDDPDAVPLMASLLSIVAEGVPPPAMSPPEQKARTFAVLRQILVAQVRRGPTIVIYEDLHWLDPTSGEFLDDLVDSCRDVPLFLLGTSRPGAPYTLPDRPNVASFTIGRLSASESGQIVTALGVEAGLTSDVVARIVERTDGVPLFVEEMTRMLLESPEDSAGRALPVTLMDLLTERLDRLGSGKLLLQVGAVVGREFRRDIVAAVLGCGTATLDADLAPIAASGLIEAGPEGVVTFKHALVQDAAYASILNRDRRDLHGRVAACLQSRFEDLCQSEPELVARHLTQAGKGLDSARWWLLGGRQAIGRGSPHEAAALLQAGLDALAGEDRTERLLAAELDLLAVLGPAQMVLNGPGSGRFGAVQRRAYDTSALLPGTPALFPITYGLALYHWGKAEFGTAHALARKLAAAAEDEPTPERVMAANIMQGMIHFHLGATAAAARHLEATVALYETERHAALYPRYMMDFGVFGRFYLALCRSSSGRPDDAIVLAREAAALADGLGQPHSRGFALLAGFIVAMLGGDVWTARSGARRCLAFAAEMGFPEFVAFAQIAIGWADIEDGQIESGLSSLEAGIHGWKATGFETWQTLFGAIRVQGLARLGRLDEAGEELAMQDARMLANGERQFASHLDTARRSLLDRRQGNAGSMAWTGPVPAGVPFREPAGGPHPSDQRAHRANG